MIAFLPRRKAFNFMAAITICSDFGAPQNKDSHCLHSFPIYLAWSDGTGCYDLSFLNVELEANFFTLLFHFHQEALYFFTFFHKGGVTCVSEIMIFFLAFLIPACASSSLAFGMMYSVYKLNKQHDNIQPWHTPFPIWNQSIVSPTICHEVKGLDAMIFFFWMWNFKAALSLS